MNNPVMETTIEGAQKRIAAVIESLTDFNVANDLEYIAVFLDSVGDEMAAISSSCNSLHDRYVQALAAIDEWQEEVKSITAVNEQLRKERDSYISRLHAAHDNR